MLAAITCLRSERRFFRSIWMSASVMGGFCCSAPAGAFGLAALSCAPAATDPINNRVRARVEIAAPILRMAGIFTSERFLPGRANSRHCPALLRGVQQLSRQDRKFDRRPYAL